MACSSHRARLALLDALPLAGHMCLVAKHITNMLQESKAINILVLIYAIGEAGAGLL